MVKQIVNAQQILIGIMDSKTNNNISGSKCLLEIINQNIIADNPDAFTIVVGILRVIT